MSTPKITKNVLLDNLCDNCKFGYGQDDQRKCKKVVYNTIEETNEDGYVTVEQLYPVENTCEDWKEALKAGFLNIKFNTIEIDGIGAELNISWTKEIELVAGNVSEEDSDSLK